MILRYFFFFPHAIFEEGLFKNIKLYIHEKIIYQKLNLQ